MPCAVAAVSSSPIFMPSPRNLSPIFCKNTASPPTPSRSLLSPLALKHIRKLPFNGGEINEIPPPKVATMSKRKRPSSINIPLASLGFDDVKIEMTSDSDRLSEVEVEGEGYSLYCKRGKRGGGMEDRYVLRNQGDSRQAFFGVFDGHGGAGAAEFAANNLEKNIMNELSKINENDIEQAVKEGYLTTDSEFLKQDIRGGTCSVTAFFHKGNVVVSNAGDCRAVMSRGGVAEALTVDHKPSLESERERIESVGGYVDCCRGVWRVHGSLAVSRAIGDRHLKQWVIAEPSTKVIEITPECEFLIMASDGLWDNVSNQEAVDIVRTMCAVDNNTNSLSACKKLVDLSLTRGSVDDISVMVIQLDRFIQ